MPDLKTLSSLTDSKGGKVSCVGAGRLFGKQIEMSDDSMSNPVRVLLIEDNPVDARLIHILLNQVVEMEFEIKSTTSLSDGIASLGQFDPDIVLLDRSLPDSAGPETLSRMRQVSGMIPIIMLTASEDAELGLAAVRDGAQDFLVKGNVDGAILYGIERQRAERQLAEQATLLDLASDAIFVCDLDHNIRYVNKQAIDLYSLSKNQIGNPLPESIATVSGFDGAWESALEEGQWSGEFKHTGPSGKTVAVLSRWTLVRDERGNPESILMMTGDVSDHRTLEAQIIRAQRLENIATLAVGIAHDLNNVLAPVLMGTQILKSRVDDEHLAHLLDNMEKSAQRGASVVKEVLSFAKGGDGAPVRMQLKHVTRKCYKVMQETFPKHIEVSRQADDDLWTIKGDAGQLEQVVMNLCINARDAMPEGGQLQLSANNVELDDTTHHHSFTSKPGPYVLMTVRDNGEGMTEETLEKIFDPFFTTKEIGKGTGMGMSTVQGIIKSHGGFIDIDSKLGEGTEIKVGFPAVDVPVEEPEQIALPAIERQGSKETILLVEDDESLLEVTKTLLVANDYQVIVAVNGADALSEYDANKDKIDAVITDLMMPVMGGPAIVQIFKKRNPDLPVLAVSGGATRESKQAMESLHNVIFLRKPYSTDKFLETVNDLLKLGNHSGVTEFRTLEEPVLASNE